MENNRKDLGGLEPAPDLCRVLTCMQVVLRAEAREERTVCHSGLHLGNESASTQQSGGERVRR